MCRPPTKSITTANLVVLRAVTHFVGIIIGHSPAELSPRLPESTLRYCKGHAKATNPVLQEDKSLNQTAIGNDLWRHQMLDLAKQFIIFKSWNAEIFHVINIRNRLRIMNNSNLENFNLWFMGTTDNCLHNPICVKPKTRKEQQYWGIQMCNKITIRLTPLKKSKRLDTKSRLVSQMEGKGEGIGKQYYAIGIIPVIKWIGIYYGLYLLCYRTYMH